MGEGRRYRHTRACRISLGGCSLSHLGHPGPDRQRAPIWQVWLRVAPRCCRRPRRPSQTSRFVTSPAADTRRLFALRLGVGWLATHIVIQLRHRMAKCLPFYLRLAGPPLYRPVTGWRRQRAGAQVHKETFDRRRRPTPLTQSPTVVTRRTDRSGPYVDTFLEAG